MKPRTPDTHETRQHIVNHLKMYRITVPDALDRIASLSSIAPRTIRCQLHALVDRGIVGKGSLYGTRPYYYLIRHPTEPNQPDTNRPAPSGPPSEQAKLRSYAMLAFCCLTNTLRIKLSSAEIAALCPQLSHPGLPSGYYRELIGHSPKLGLACIDSSARGRWDRIVAKLQKHVYTHTGHATLRERIHRGLFEFTIITALPQKAARISAALADLEHLRGVVVRICVIPELLHLIAPPSTRLFNRSKLPSKGFAALPVPGARKNNGMKSRRSYTP